MDSRGLDYLEAYAVLSAERTEVKLGGKCLYGAERLANEKSRGESFMRILIWVFRHLV